MMNLKIELQNNQNYFQTLDVREEMGLGGNNNITKITKQGFMATHLFSISSIRNGSHRQHSDGSRKYGIMDMDDNTFVYSINCISIRRRKNIQIARIVTGLKF